jgi:hypothetical protein
MPVTSEVVFFGSIYMEGTCDHCGTAWSAEGTKQPGMNDRGQFNCPNRKCKEPVGSMHCAVGPFVKIHRARKKS